MQRPPGLGRPCTCRGRPGFGSLEARWVIVNSVRLVNPDVRAGLPEAGGCIDCVGSKKRKRGRNDQPTWSCPALDFRDVNASFEAATIALERVPAELGRWAAWHWLRTALGAAAFAAAVLGIRSRE